MFALEISFLDGVSQSEMIFIRRPQALIGSSDYAHVVVEDLRNIDCQLRVVRQQGRAFKCMPLGKEENVEFADGGNGSFDGDGSIQMGGVRLHLTALDSDLGLRDAEPPDRAGCRVLRQACAASSPVYPALVVRGAVPMVVSFAGDQPIFVGRSKQCVLRLDSADISARHARVGFEHGEFWVEDLGSTNGTFVNGQQISGRVNVQPGTVIVLGRELSVVVVSSADQSERATTSFVSHDIAVQPEHRYPVVVSLSEVARPARLVLQAGNTVCVGRDPGSDMWLGAPHISRKHCMLTMERDGTVVINDMSTNGTAHDTGLLRRGDNLSLHDKPAVLDLGGSITVCICFNEEQERAFQTSGGALRTFQPETVEEKFVSSKVFEVPAPEDFASSKTSAHMRMRSLLYRLKRLPYAFRSLNATGRVMALGLVVGVGGVVVIVTSLLVGLLR